MVKKQASRKRSRKQSRRKQSRRKQRGGNISISQIVKDFELKKHYVSDIWNIFNEYEHHYVQFKENIGTLTKNTFIIIQENNEKTVIVGKNISSDLLTKLYQLPKKELYQLDDDIKYKCEMDSDIYDDDYGNAYGFPICAVEIKGRTKTVDGTRTLQLDVRATPDFVQFGDDCDKGCSGYFFLEPVKEIKSNMVMPTLMTLERLGIDSDIINKDFNKNNDTQNKYIDFEISDISKINLYISEEDILDAIIENSKTKKEFEKFRLKKESY